MTAIDHRAEALEHVEDAVTVNGLYLMQKAIGLAQVHATLAVAEQARIANLIALYRLSEEDAMDFARQGVSFPQVSLAIREGLGI